MHSDCYSHSSPVKNCAKWLLLSLAFVWLVGCSTMQHRKMAKRDPFGDTKFSCGEEKIPRGPASAPLTASAPYNPRGAEMSPGAANQPYGNGYPNQMTQMNGNPQYANPGYPPAGTMGQVPGNQGYMNTSNREMVVNGQQYTNQTYVNPLGGKSEGSPRSNTRVASIATGSGVNSAPVTKPTTKVAKPATVVDDGAEDHPVAQNAGGARETEDEPAFGMPASRGSTEQNEATHVGYSNAAGDGSGSSEASQAAWYDSEK